MRAREFVKRVCVASWCPDFNWDHGCRAYDGEECDEAFCHSLWRGKSMVDRVNEFCWARRDRKEKKEKARRSANQP